mmetsp:Transcript_8066/g.12683  ORF Transcript_8066/g.12683 Transcript_8066/m.12683 type:complete len:269 (-) Transcript_8066:400-1206(-)
MGATSEAALDDAPASLPPAPPATAAVSVDSASDSTHPYSSSSGRHANLCCRRQSMDWHERLQYRTRPQQLHRRNSWRRVSTRPHRGCEHACVPGARGLPARPYQSSRKRFSGVAVRCASAAVLAAAETSAAAATAAWSVLMSLRLRRRSSTAAAAAVAAVTAASTAGVCASCLAASASSRRPSGASCSTPKPSCRQCPSSRFAGMNPNKMLPRAHSSAPASGSLSLRLPPLPLKCIMASEWCASGEPATAALARSAAPVLRCSASPAQ